MNASVMNGNFNRYMGFDKEEKHMDMIRTGRYKNYGQLEDQAAGTVDVEAFVFRNGEVVPANQAENSTTPVIKTPDEPNYGQLEDQASGIADVESIQHLRKTMHDKEGYKCTGTKKRMALYCSLKKMLS